MSVRVRKGSARGRRYGGDFQGDGPFELQSKSDALTHENRFPDWRRIYADQPVENMPWYNPNLDKYLEMVLEVQHILHGTFLDIGTGPATQALLLAKKGFKVTGTDLSLAAISRAKSFYSPVIFIQDDFLDSKLSETFDYVLDRGCFHVIAPEDRARYTEQLGRVTRPGSLVFLKCFSHREPATGAGPYRFSENDIQNIFGEKFVIEEMKKSGYHGTQDDRRKSLFVTMRKK